MNSDPEFFTFREGSMWICAWSRFDLVTQGPTEKEACMRMLKVIAGTLILAAEAGALSAPGFLRPVPPAILKRWRRAHYASHGN